METENGMNAAVTRMGIANVLSKRKNRDILFLLAAISRRI